MQTQEISTLRNLIQMNRDAADGLYTAAKSINDTPMKIFLTRCARLRDKYARLLSLDLDKVPEAAVAETEESYVNNVWHQVKLSTYKFNPAAILKECQKAEEYILSAYEDALSMNLPSGIKNSLHRQKKNLYERYYKMVNLIGQFEGWITGTAKPSSH